MATRERVERALALQETGRVRVYDLLLNDAAFEHFSGEKLRGSPLRLWSWLAAWGFGLVSFCVPAPGAPGLAGPGRIYGKITAKDTGEPVAGATVRAHPRPTGKRISARTDADGQFECKGLPFGDYHVRASHPDFVEQAHGRPQPLGYDPTITLTAGHHEREVSFALERAARISGAVLDEAGAPVAGCRVYAIKEHHEPRHWPWRSAGHSRTDGAGRFTVVGLPRGEYVMVARLPSEAAKRLGMERLVAYSGGARSPEDAKRVSVASGATVEGVDVRVRATGGMTVRGKIVAVESGLPIPGAKVVLIYRKSHLHWIEARANDDGTYDLDMAGTGPYQVVADARDQGYARQSKWVDFAKGDRPKAVDFELEMGVALSGTFATDDGGLLPATARIYAWAKPRTSRMAPRIHFMISDSRSTSRRGATMSLTSEWTGVCAGAQYEGMRVERVGDTYHFRARAACPGMPTLRFLPYQSGGYYVKAIEFEEFDMMRDPPEFQPGQDVSGITVTLSRKCGKISGTLRYKGTGEPAAWVGLGTKWAGTDCDSSHRRQTNAQGQFSLSVPVDRHTVHVSAGEAELSPDLVPIEVKFGETTRVEATVVKEAKEAN